MHKYITKIITLIPSVETKEDPKLLNIGLILHQLKTDTSISAKSKELAKDALECINMIMNECSEFNREINKLALIAEEMSFTYDKNYWLKSIKDSGKYCELINTPCDICNTNPSLAMEFLKELDNNVDQIHISLFKIKLNPEDRGLSRLCYKSCHTLKGIAGYLDLKRLQHLLLLAEKYILKYIKNDQSIDEECISFLFKVFACLKEYFKNWKERGDCVIIIPDSIIKLQNEYQISGQNNFS